MILAAALLFSACNTTQPISPVTTEPATPTPTPAPITSPTVMKPRTINLLLQNKSGEKGAALLEDIDGKLRVTLTLTGEPKGGSQPAHIHVGLCPTPGAVKYPLTNVVNGKSVTTLDLTISDLLSMGDMAINVHKSVADINVYVACGDVK